MQTIKTETFVNINNRKLLIEMCFDYWNGKAFTEHDIDFVTDWETGEILNAIPFMNPTPEQWNMADGIKARVMEELVRTQPDFVYQAGLYDYNP